MNVRELVELLLKEDQDAVVKLADWNEDYAEATDLIALVRREGEVVIDAAEPAASNDKGG